MGCGLTLLEGAKVLEALALKGGVADGLDLVDEQDVGLGAGGDSEARSLHRGTLVEGLTTTLRETLARHVGLIPSVSTQ